MSDPTSRPLKPVKRRPWLLAVALAPWNYPLSFVADATASLGMLAWSVVTLERPGALVPVAICALLGYTLAEYSWHRWLFHWARAPRVFREGHGRHHAAPEARLALPFFTAVPHALVVWGLSAAVIGSSLGAFFAGVWLLGYLAYGGLHHLVHTPAVQSRPVTRLRAVHDVHHARPSLNFGVTTPLWDWVFGTWSAPKSA
jgi:sterol desaturase/sphingolipid hydroxylase (fatty acid hydroxylase superfamily)